MIRSLEFVGGLASIGGWRPESNLPEIAFAGRSNVGKSSLLNKVLKRRSFARVSKTPGRTREINFFKVNDAFLLADLPGYGYAKVSKSRSAEWGPLIESYLRSTTLLKGVVQLLDVRHDPTDDDRQMLDFLADVAVPAMFVATKTDKLSKLAVSRRVSDLAIILQVEEDHIIPFSAQTGEGRDELAAAIAGLLAVEPAA
ncbi:MAG: ribosome biogenesis GTP-binding protein YihA/YsxC [Gemmatimonadota bacterium]|nr:ribosome biogenesis GTP-binding protein YihA/YsxC [Gemmatimonadota bacterium]